MGLPSERNRAANKGGPLLIIGMIAYLSEESQIICGALIKILGKEGIRCVQNRNYPSSFFLSGKRRLQLETYASAYQSICDLWMGTSQQVVFRTARKSQKRV
jgi:hypothetical protein